MHTQASLQLCGAGWEVFYIHVMQEESEALRADRTCCLLTSHARICTEVCVAQKSMRKEGSRVLFATYKLGNLGKSVHLSCLSLPICKNVAEPGVESALH